MVQEQQVGGGVGHFDAADPCVVDARLAERMQVQLEIMGQQRSNDVAMGHKYIRAVLRDLQCLFDCCDGTLLDFPERFTA